MKTPVALLDYILRNSGKARAGTNAFALWSRLIAAHAVRVQQGETFALNISAMVAADTIPGWTLDRLRKAKDTLCRLGLLHMVRGRSFNPEDGMSFAPIFIITLPDDFLGARRVVAARAAA